MSNAKRSEARAQIRLTLEEEEEFEAAAKREHFATFSEWARQAMWERARQTRVVNELPGLRKT